MDDMCDLKKTYVRQCPESLGGQAYHRMDPGAHSALEEAHSCKQFNWMINCDMSRVFRRLRKIEISWKPWDHLAAHPA